MIKFLRYLCFIFHLPFLITITYELGMEPIEGTLRVFRNRKELKLEKDYILSNNKEIQLL